MKWLVSSNVCLKFEPIFFTCLTLFETYQLIGIVVYLPALLESILKSTQDTL